MFELGKVVATPGIIELIEQGLDAANLLGRHYLGDWGDMDSEDIYANNEALREGFRLLSSYNTKQGKVWIITEADRSATTLLLPEEY